MKLGFIGTGNLATAILRGVCASDLLPANEIAIYDINTEKTDLLSKELGVIKMNSAQEIAGGCSTVVVAVKPKDIQALVSSVSEQTKANGTVVISTAAGTGIKKLTGYFGYGAKIVRIMPNINAAAGESMTALCVSDSVSDEEKAFALDFCGCFGKAVELEEKYFSAFTAVAGSAPAFAYMFADALASAAVKYGIAAKDARFIASQMLFGSAKMLLESDKAVSELVSNVCSPGGTTIEGVCSLKKTGFEDSVITAIDKTVEKDRLMSEKR